MKLRRVFLNYIFDTLGRWRNASCGACSYLSLLEASFIPALPLLEVYGMCFHGFFLFCVSALIILLVFTFVFFLFMLFLGASGVYWFPSPIIIFSLHLKCYLNNTWLKPHNVPCFNKMNNQINNTRGGHRRINNNSSFQLRNLINPTCTLKIQDSLNCLVCCEQNTVSNGPLNPAWLSSLKFSIIVCISFWLPLE